MSGEDVLLLAELRLAGVDAELPVLTKVAIPDAATALGIAAGGAIGAATFAGVYATLPAKDKKQVREELHDPRLYSNLRGMMTLEGRKKRVAAHKLLNMTKNKSILSAANEGFRRRGNQ